MNNYLLITHGFNEFQIHKIVRKMADLRDAKTGLYSETEMRARLHHAIEDMTGSDSARIEDNNRSKKGVKSDVNDSKQMTLDLWNGANDE